MLNFNEKKSHLTIFIPITLLFILFMPNYLFLAEFFLSFHFSSFIGLLDPDTHSECGSGSRMAIECGSRMAIECGSGTLVFTNAGNSN
jgi:hypothetical protein